VKYDNAWLVLKQRQQLLVNLVSRRMARYTNVVFYAPVGGGSVPVAISSAAFDRRQRLKCVDEAVVGVRILGDDWYVMPAIGVKDADDGGSGERSHHVQL